MKSNGTELNHYSLEMKIDWWNLISLPVKSSFFAGILFSNSSLIIQDISVSLENPIIGIKNIKKKKIYSFIT